MSSIFISSSPPILSPILHLCFALASLLFSLILILLEARLNPRPPRLLLSGDATTTPLPELPPRHQTSKTPKRAKACIAILRLLLGISVTASLVVASLQLIRFVTASPVSTIASKNTNTFASTLMKRSLLKFSTDAKGMAKYSKANIGIGKSLVNAKGNGGGSARLLLAVLLAAIAIVCIVGIVLSIIAERIRAQRAVCIIIFSQSATFLVVSIVATLVWPTSLPYHSTVLVNHWMDRAYKLNHLDVNETRFLGNWYAKIPGSESEPVVPLDGFADAFCIQFKEMLGETGAEVEVIEEGPPADIGGITSPPVTVPATTAVVTTTEADQIETTTAVLVDEEEEDEPDVETDGTEAPSTTALRPPERQLARQGSAESLSFQKLNKDEIGQFFSAYLIGKPSGREDAFRIMSYMALGALIGAPVAVAQFCRMWLLMPFVFIWAAIWFAFMLLGTPSTLRILAAPSPGVQVFQVCETGYRILVKDDRTKLVAALDAAFFAVALLVGLVNGFRWLKIGERRLNVQDQKEVKLINYEDVYSGSGALRW